MKERDVNQARMWKVGINATMELPNLLDSVRKRS